MKRIFTEDELERMIKFTTKILYETIKEEPRYNIDGIPEDEAKKTIKEWLSAMNDNDLQVEFVRACTLVVEKAINQAVEEDS